jgi:hypothetical protein
MALLLHQTAAAGGLFPLRRAKRITGFESATRENVLRPGVKHAHGIGGLSGVNAALRHAALRHRDRALHATTIA